MRRQKVFQSAGARKCTYIEYTFNYTIVCNNNVFTSHGRERSKLLSRSEKEKEEIGGIRLSAFPYAIMTFPSRISKKKVIPFSSRIKIEEKT